MSSLTDLDAWLIDNPVWKDRAGRLIKMTNMTSDHIRNCIAMLERMQVDPYDVVGDHDEFRYTLESIAHNNSLLNIKVTQLKAELARREAKR